MVVLDIQGSKHISDHSTSQSSRVQRPIVKVTERIGRPRDMSSSREQLSANLTKISEKTAHAVVQRWVTCWGRDPRDGAESDEDGLPTAHKAKRSNESSAEDVDDRPRRGRAFHSPPR